MKMTDNGRQGCGNDSNIHRGDERCCAEGGHDDRGL